MFTERHVVILEALPDDPDDYDYDEDEDEEEEGDDDEEDDDEGDGGEKWYLRQRK